MFVQRALRTCRADNEHSCIALTSEWCTVYAGDYGLCLGLSFRSSEATIALKRPLLPAPLSLGTLLSVSISPCSGSLVTQEGAGRFDVISSF